MTLLFIIQGKPFKSKRLNCSDISSTVIKILTYYLIRSYLLKRWNLVRLHHWCFPCKFMNFSEAATGGVLWKKMFLKNLQHSQEVEDLQLYQKTLFSSEYCEIFKSTYFEEHLLRTACLKQHRTPVSSWLFY